MGFHSLLLQLDLAAEEGRRNRPFLPLPILDLLHLPDLLRLSLLILIASTTPIGWMQLDDLIGQFSDTLGNLLPGGS
jgi:hypothetical protein